MAEISSVFKKNNTDDYGLGNLFSKSNTNIDVNEYLKNSTSNNQAPTSGSQDSYKFELPKFNSSGLGNLFSSPLDDTSNVQKLNDAYMDLEKSGLTGAEYDAKLNELNKFSVDNSSSVISSGLGSLTDALNKYGSAGLTGLNIYKGIDDLFGSGKTARKLELDAAKENLSRLKTDTAWKKEDRDRFLKEREAANKAYFGG